jgi:hypothetical protein
MGEIARRDRGRKAEERQRGETKKRDRGGRWRERDGWEEAEGKRSSKERQKTECFYHLYFSFYSFLRKAKNGMYLSFILLIV